MLRALVVDDSAVYRKILSKAVEATGLARVKSLATSGAEAIQFMKTQRFDFVLLDVHLPDYHGIQLLTELLQIDVNSKIIMVSSTTSEQVAKLTVEALEKGALDFIAKPLDESFDKNMEIVSTHLTKLLMAWPGANAAGARPVVQRTEQAESAPSERKRSRRRFDMVVICSSTGGPAALEQIVAHLPATLRAPLVIVQHMPRDFTRVLADSLNGRSPLAIAEAIHEQPMEARRGFVAPGGQHLILSKQKHESILLLEDSDYVNGVRPAADKLFQSIARNAPGMRILAVVLTGMGVDGTEGVRQLKQSADCYCLAQNEATSVVYGMPRSIIEKGLADEVLPIQAIASRITELVQFGVSEHANESI
jgi:two-component system chemotaxis response regulator CheB